MGRSSLRQFLKRCKIAANERLLLGPAPSLDPSFGFDRVCDAVKPVRKDKFYGPP